MWKNVFLGLSVVLLVFSFISCSDETETMFTVTFNSNGGSNVSSISGIKSGTTIELPVNPTKTGFIFSGWFFDNETFINQFTSLTEITNNIVVFARWNEPIKEKYRFANGSWWKYPESEEVVDAISELGESSFSVYGGGVNISYIGVYTLNGGLLSDWGASDDAEWAYLYNMDGKIGIVVTDSRYGIYAMFGKSMLNDFYSSTYSEWYLDDMQDLINGFGFK